MKRVCMMTSVHPAQDVRIYHREAVSLAQAGYAVVVLNSFYSGRDAHNIRFIRVQLAKSRAGRMLSASSVFGAAALRMDADIYHFHDPELIPAGLRLKAKGKTVIYDVHEDLPLQILDKPWLPQWQRGAVSALADRFERRACNRFDVCLCATEDIAEKFPNSRVLHNYPDPAEFPLSAIPFECRRFDAAYVGSITASRGISAMLEAARLGGFSLALAGSFESEALECASSRHPGWEQVAALGRLDRESVGKLMATSRCGLLLLDKTPAYERALPVKLFEYMMAGLPVVATDIPLWRKLAGQDCALFVNPEKPGEAAAAVQWLIHHPQQAREMGAAGRERALERYSFETERQTLLDIYERLS